MTDENIDLDSLDSEIETESKVQKRIKDLSEKVRLSSEERDEQSRLYKEQSSKNAELQRERDFFAGFADVVSSNPQARDHKDDILAKVKSGYTVEDATFAVLGKAGKLGNPSQPKQVERHADVDFPGGGSSPTQHTAGGQKSLSQLTREEKRTLLLESEARGDLSAY